MKLRCCFSSESGSVMPVVGMLIAAMVGAAGAAVDTGRGQLVKAKLSSSMDAARPAAGATVNTATLQTEATKYLNVNFDNYMGAHITSFTMVPNANNTVFELAADAEVPTTFMNIMGIPSIHVHATSEITRQSSGLELVMVLDNTGSMAGSKLTSLKSASHSLVDILYGGQNNVENLWIGLVPFSQAVNIGTSHPTWLTSDSFDWGRTTYTGSWGTTGYAGCVDARETGGRDITDEPPSITVPATLFPRYYWQDFYPTDSNNHWKSTSSKTTTAGPTTTTTCNKSSSCTCTNYGPCTTTTSTAAPVTTTTSNSTTTSTTTTTTTKACNNSGSSSKWSCTTAVSTSTPSTTTTYTINVNQGPNLYCPQPVTPMTANKGTINTAIDSMVADGNTHIGLGAVWGWRMLSPRWRNMWGGEMNANSLPLDYNTPKMSKAVIIMTDGDNTIDNTSHGGYWYLKDGHLGTTSSSAGVTQLNTRLSNVCTSMKNNNIIVYTISFGTVNSTSGTMLRNCASQPNFYFPSPDGATLQNTFRAIGDSLSNLRVSK